MDPEDQNPESAPQTSGASATSGGSTQTSVDWEKRFKGLQATFDKLQKKYEALQVENQQLTADLEEVRQGTRGHENEKKGLNDKLTQAEREKADLASQLEANKFAIERARLILGEFTDLSQFEAKGLLPSATTVEELREKLTDYRETIKGMVSNGVQTRIAGQSPASGSSASGGGARTKEQVYNELVSLAGARSPQERKKYEEVLHEWDELNK